MPITVTARCYHLPVILLGILVLAGLGMASQPLAAADSTPALAPRTTTMPPSNAVSGPGSADPVSPAKPFIVQRTFHAPRALVWKAWTEQERLKHWFAPVGATYVAGTFDVRPGSASHYCMRQQDGSEEWGTWVFCDIIPPERLVYIDAFSDRTGAVLRQPGNPHWPLQMLTTVTFTEADGVTTLNLVWTPFNANADEHAMFESAFKGMQHGWKGTLDQLEAYLAKP